LARPTSVKLALEPFVCNYLASARLTSATALNLGGDRGSSSQSWQEPDLIPAQASHHPGNKQRLLFNSYSRRKRPLPFVISTGA
jgi:hypothetical protein